MNLRSCILCVPWLLCAAACDPTEAPDWRDSAAALGSPDELASVLPLCEALPPESAASELVPTAPQSLADAPRVAEGVCSTGHWEFKSVTGSCGSCTIGPGDAGNKVSHYQRFCYDAPSPPSCGCEGWDYDAYTCMNFC